MRIEGDDRERLSGIIWEFEKYYNLVKNYIDDESYHTIEFEGCFFKGFLKYDDDGFRAEIKNIEDK